METTDACDWCSSIVELHYETTKALTGVKQYRGTWQDNVYLLCVDKSTKCSFVEEKHCYLLLQLLFSQNGQMNKY